MRRDLSEPQDTTSRPGGQGRFASSLRVSFGDAHGMLGNAPQALTASPSEWWTIRCHTISSRRNQRYKVEIVCHDRQTPPAVSDLVDQPVPRIVAISLVKASEPKPNHISDTGAGTWVNTSARTSSGNISVATPSGSQSLDPE